MSDDRFAPPGAEVSVPVVASEVPDSVRKKIRNAWIAGLVSAATTLVFVLVAMSGTNLFGFSAMQLIDVGIILGLTFGIYKKSRICAVLMLVYFVIAKIDLMLQPDVGTRGIFLSLVFFYFYLQGVIGTFAYHKHLKQAAA